MSFGGDGGDINALDECNILVIRKPSYCRPPLRPLRPLPPPRGPDLNHQTIGLAPPPPSLVKDIQTAFSLGRGVSGCVVGGTFAYWAAPQFGRFFVPGRIFTAGFTAGGCVGWFLVSYIDPNPRRVFRDL